MKVIVDYDPVSGNINTPMGIYYIGMNLVLPEAGNEAQTQQPSDVVKLSNNGMTADDLIKMRKAGVI